MRDQTFETQLHNARLDFDRLHREFSQVRNALRQTKYSGDQPRAPAGNANGGEWIDAGSSNASAASAAESTQRIASAAVIAQAAPLLTSYLGRQAVWRGLSAGMAAFATIVHQQQGGAGAFVQFNAAEFERRDAGELRVVSRGVLTKEQVLEVCPRLTEVQARTDETVARLRTELPDLPPWLFGTAVHTSMKTQINIQKDEYFRAEISAEKSKSESTIYERAVRIDILEFTNRNDLCIYDLKTGARGLSLRRSIELAGEAAKIASIIGVIPRRIILIEVRPKR